MISMKNRLHQWKALKKLNNEDLNGLYRFLIGNGENCWPKLAKNACFR